MPENGHIGVYTYWLASVRAQDCIVSQPISFLSASWTLVGTTELVRVIVVYLAY